MARTTLFFARSESQFYTTTVNSRGVRSDQIDGTAAERYSLIVLYGRPDSGRHEMLGEFDRIDNAQRVAERHFRTRAA